MMEMCLELRNRVVSRFCSLCWLQVLLLLSKLLVMFLRKVDVLCVLIVVLTVMTWVWTVVLGGAWV